MQSTVRELLEVSNTKMKFSHILFLYFLGTLLVVNQSSAQDRTSIPGPELTYIHTDRSTYFIGEDLWYKAYTVNGYRNLLSSESNVLYVELISPTGTIISRNKTNLEMGLGNGDFELLGSSGITEGIYALRAYTNWNRNYGSDFVFTKNIEIIDPFRHSSKKGETTDSSVKPLGSNVETQNSFQIDFFPEGGSLIENVASVIAFKAIDHNGRSIAVTGEVYDGNHRKITAFNTAHDGMGQFQLFPLKGEHYYAEVTSSLGHVIQKSIPTSLETGYTLSYKKLNEKNLIAISTNKTTLQQTANQKLKIILSSRGIPYLEIQKQLSGLSTSFTIPEGRLLPGITAITLYDAQSIPHSERLIYKNQEQTLQISLNPDKSIYKPGEKVHIDILSDSRSGSFQAASYSLSATDTNAISDSEMESSICSYFFLESDIRGTVFQPSYYFDRSNPDRLKHLDNLLLTQGWRDFIWRKTNLNKDTITFKTEKGFSVSGRLKRVFGEKALVNSSVTLGLVNKYGFKALSTKTDSLGDYYFKNLVFFGPTNLYLNATNEKGKTHGYLLLDPLDQKPMPVTLKHTSARSLSSSQTLTKNFLKKFEWLGVNPENILNEVVITTKKEDEPSALYSAVDYTYFADDKTKDLPTIYDVLSEVPGVIVVDRTAFIPGEKTSPLILVDNYANSEALNFIDPIEVIKIEVIRFSEILPPIFGEESRGGIIAITTNGKSRMNQPKKIPVHTINKKIKGYYESRNFYTEVENSLNTEEEKHLAAIRNTIFWSPYITPSNGKAEVEFHTTRVETNVQVILEGITSGGIPVTARTSFQVSN